MEKSALGEEDEKKGVMQAIDKEEGVRNRRRRRLILRRMRRTKRRMRGVILKLDVKKMDVG